MHSRRDADSTMSIGMDKTLPRPVYQQNPWHGRSYPPLAVHDADQRAKIRHEAAETEAALANMVAAARTMRESVQSAIQ